MLPCTFTDFMFKLMLYVFNQKTNYIQTFSHYSILYEILPRDAMHSARMLS